MRERTYYPKLCLVQLAYGGSVVQVGNVVTVGASSTGTKITLPKGAVMLDYRERAIYYRSGISVRSRRLGDGSDTLLLRIPVRPSQPILFSVDWGAGWARGATVSWRT